jgi:hypothetical protein
MHTMGAVVEVVLGDDRVGSRYLRVLRYEEVAGGQ